jgi:hypothetical protein
MPLTLRTVKGTPLTNAEVDGNFTYLETISTSNVNITGGVIAGVSSISATDFNSTSDITLKDNVQQISNPINILRQLDGIEFSWKDTGAKAYGLSAQQVESVLPDIVKTHADGHKGVNYNNIIAFLVEAVKDLSKQVESLSAKK